MNTLAALPGLNAGRFGFLWGVGAAQHLQNQIRTGLGCARSSSMPSGRVSPFLVNQKAGRQASQEKRTNPYCGSWHLAGQEARSSHGAQSCNRRSDQDQSKQESRVPCGQGVGRLPPFSGRLLTRQDETTGV